MRPDPVGAAVRGDVEPGGAGAPQAMQRIGRPDGPRATVGVFDSRESDWSQPAAGAPSIRITNKLCPAATRSPGLSRTRSPTRSSLTKGPVGAPQVAKVAPGRVDLDEEVVTRKRRVFGHRAMDEPRSAHDERVVAVEHERLPSPRALNHIEDHAHRRPVHPVPVLVPHDYLMRDTDSTPRSVESIPKISVRGNLVATVLGGSLLDDASPIVAPEVAQALRAGRGVVALESTLITHGLPWPDNVEVARPPRPPSATRARSRRRSPSWRDDPGRPADDEIRTSLGRPTSRRRAGATWRSASASTSTPPPPSRPRSGLPARRESP